MSALNFGFVDQVLPRSNARLRNLLIDIGRKKPTFELQEQVINEVPPSQYFLRANRIDGATGRLAGSHHLRRRGRREPADHLRRQRADGLRGGPDRPEPAALRWEHPPVPSGGPHRVPADLLQGQRYPGEERVRRAGAEHQRVRSGRPGDEHLRDARRDPGRRPGGDRGAAGSARAAAERPPHCCWPSRRSPRPTPSLHDSRPRPTAAGSQSVQELVLPRTAEAQGTAQAKPQDTKPGPPSPRARPPARCDTRSPPESGPRSRRFPTGR